MNYNNLRRMQLLGYWNATGPPAQHMEVYTDPATLHRHDWGVFGEYQYLGKGTPATRKTEAGVQPRNEIDRLAQEHDLYYVRTRDFKGMRSPVRGFVDYGAGSAMILTSANPWMDLTGSERLLGVIAGTGLIAQGLLRLWPKTVLGMGLVDRFFY